MNKDLLIIFIKNPILGKVKSRLAATVGPEKALAIYHQLLHRTQKVTQNLPVDKALYYADFIPEKDSWDTAVYTKYLQVTGDLGQRMEQAFQQGFSDNYNRICIIGSDCFELSSEIIQQAFRRLEDKDVVIGPAEDGGYYLLGLTQHQPFLFQNKHWSTESVLLDTLQDVKAKNLSVTLLPTLTDVDEEKDLVTMQFVKS
ncbi:MAG: TIGR04282 family arsenosugar biosynthesis glycosyltransferase [Adhaeribacter sp.]